VSVLLVEDDPLLRKFVEALREAVYHVIHASTGKRRGPVQAPRRWRAGHRCQAVQTGRWVADRGALPRAGWSEPGDHL